MDTEEFYGITEDKLFEFVDECATEDRKLLEIKTSEQAAKFVLIAKKFSGASILRFFYDSGNTSPRRLFKRSNDIVITIGAEVFLPGLRYGETYDDSIKMLFKDVVDFSFIPGSIDVSTEIGIDKFEIKDGIWEFKCFSKNDETKEICIKSKSLFIENFIDSDDEDVSFSDSIIKKARFMFKQKNYQECIRILKFEYFNLENDASANNLLSLCYLAQNDQYEAIRYINYAIELDSKPWEFFYNKGLCLWRCNLPFDTLKCYNTALSLCTSEKNKHLVTKEIIYSVNNETQNYYANLNIKDVSSFKKYIYYFDSIIDLELGFPEIKEKYRQFKEEAIKVFFKEQKITIDNFWETNNDYDNVANNLKIILAVKNLNERIKENVQNYLERCMKILKNKEQQKKQKEELSNYIYDLLSKNFSIDEIIEACFNKFPSVHKYEINDILNKRNNNEEACSTYIAPLPPAWKKKDTIRDYMNSGMSKAEMVEQLSADFGISAKSALASINAYYQDDDLGLKEYFDDFDPDEDDDFFEDDFNDY